MSPCARFASKMAISTRSRVGSLSSRLKSTSTTLPTDGLHPVGLRDEIRADGPEHLLLDGVDAGIELLTEVAREVTVLIARKIDGCTGGPSHQRVSGVKRGRTRQRLQHLDERELRRDELDDGLLGRLADIQSRRHSDDLPSSGKPAAQP